MKKLSVILALSLLLCLGAFVSSAFASDGTISSQGLTYYYSIGKVPVTTVRYSITSQGVVSTTRFAYVVSFNFPSQVNSNNLQIRSIDNFYSVLLSDHYVDDFPGYPDSFRNNDPSFVVPVSNFSPFNSRSSFFSGTVNSALWWNGSTLSIAFRSDHISLDSNSFVDVFARLVTAMNVWNINSSTYSPVDFFARAFVSTNSYTRNLYSNFFFSQIDFSFPDAFESVAPLDFSSFDFSSLATFFSSASSFATLFSSVFGSAMAFSITLGSVQIPIFAIFVTFFVFIFLLLFLAHRVFRR